MKKFISLLLVLCMAMTLLPTAALASEETDDAEGTIVADFTTLKLYEYESGKYRVTDGNSNVATAENFSIVVGKTTTLRSYLSDGNEGLKTQLWYGSSASSKYVWPGNVNLANSYNLMLTIKVAAPQAGYYSPEVVFCKHDFSGDFAVYINGQYAGVIEAHDSSITGTADTDFVPVPLNLNTVYLNEGDNEVSFKVVEHYLRTTETNGTKSEGTYFYIDKLTLTPCEETFSPIEFSYDFPEKVVAGEAAEFTVSAAFNEAQTKFSGTYNEDGTEMEKKLTVASGNGDVVITEQTEKTAKGTFTATEAGTATVTATTSINGKEYSDSFDVTIASDEEVSDEEIDLQKTIAMSVTGSANSVTVDGVKQETATQTYNKNVGDSVTVVAGNIEGKIFRGWLRGGENGTVVWLDNTYTFTAATNVALYAKYTDAPAESAAVKEYYDWNGEFLAYDSYDDKQLSKYGFKFSEWLSNTVENITRYVADYTANGTYDITVPTGVNASIDNLTSVPHETEITLTNGTPVSWYVNNKLAAYGTSYTFLATEKADITIADELQESPIVKLDNVEGNTYILEYNANGKTVIEKGIIIGGDNTSITSCYNKVISQRSDASGKLMAKNDTKYTTVRGYIIYEDGDTYRVVYADIEE